MGFALVVLIIVIIGSLLQRMSGMGLGLVAGPILALLLGPVEGILVLNILAAINAVFITINVRKHVEWKKCALIGSVLILGAIPGAWLITQISTSLLQLLVGLLLLVALALVVFGATYLPPARGKIPAIVAGIAGGFMNTLAGVAGPAITVYAQASKWDQQRFAATLQPIFVISGLVSFIVKIVSGAGTISQISAWVWILGITGMFLGISLGARASRMVSRTHARKLALLLATGGGVSAVVRGLAGIL